MNITEDQLAALDDLLDLVVGQIEEEGDEVDQALDKVNAMMNEIDRFRAL